MKIQVLSDLHIEFHPFEPTPTGADVVVLAGDIHIGNSGLEWALATFPDTPVVYVLGNHEYYRHTFPDLSEQLKEQARGTNVHVMENDSVVIDGVRFLGCTLWTDFMLNGNPESAQRVAEKMLADYRAIRTENRPLNTADTAARHRRSRAWLQRELADAARPTVVVTHHVPATASIAAQYKTSAINPAFVSNLDDIVARSGARCWIHGHTHSRFDYMLGDTRVVCNPRGYPNEAGVEFDPGFTVKI